MESQVTFCAYLCVQDDPLNFSPYGTLDTMKGSFYANPVLDEPDVSPQLREAHPEYYGKNICAPYSDLPRSGYSSYIQGLRTLRRSRTSNTLSKTSGGRYQFIAPHLPIPPQLLITSFVFGVGCKLAVACQPFGTLRPTFSL